MERKVGSGILLALLFIGMLTLAFNIQPIKAESSEPPINIWNDYTLTRDITFSDHGFILRADNITLDLNGHTMTGSGKGKGVTVGWETIGSVSGVTVKNGMIENFHHGIMVEPYDSSNNTIINNNVSNCHYGIYLASSSRNTLRHNQMIACTYNFVVAATPLSDFIQDIDVSNTVNGKPIYYWVNEHDKQIPADAGYVAVINSTKIAVKDLILENNCRGVLFAYTSESSIENVTATNNEIGISLESCSSNVISDNTISLNYFCGMDLPRSYSNTITGNTISKNHWICIATWECRSNIIYHNNFIESIYQVWNYKSTSLWIHNYWSDYDGVDADGDGIGDSPYIINTENQDNFPLMEPWSPSTATTMIKALNRTVSFWNLPEGTEKSLTSKLEGALRLRHKGKDNGAFHKLMCFMNQVEALREKKFTYEQANLLISEAQRIIDLIER